MKNRSWSFHSDIQVQLEQYLKIKIVGFPNTFMQVAFFTTNYYFELGCQISYLEMVGRYLVTLPYPYPATNKPTNYPFLITPSLIIIIKLLINV